MNVRQKRRYAIILAGMLSIGMLSITASAESDGSYDEEALRLEAEARSEAVRAMLPYTPLVKVYFNKLSSVVDSGSACAYPAESLSYDYTPVLSDSRYILVELDEPNCYTILDTQGNTYVSTPPSLDLSIQGSLPYAEDVTYYLTGFEDSSYRKSVSLASLNWSQSSISEEEVLGEEITPDSPTKTAATTYTTALDLSLEPTGACSLLLTDCCGSGEDAYNIWANRDEFACEDTLTATVTIDSITQEASIQHGIMYFTVPVNGSDFDYSCTADITITGIKRGSSDIDYYTGTTTIEIPSDGLSADSYYLDIYADFNAEYGNQHTTQDDKELIDKISEMNIDEPAVVNLVSVDAGDTSDPDEPSDVKDPVVSKDPAILNIEIVNNISRYSTNLYNPSTSINVLDATTNAVLGKFSITDPAVNIKINPGKYKFQADSNLNVSYTGTLQGTAGNTTHIVLTVSPKYTLNLTSQGDMVSAYVNGKVIRGETRYDLILEGNKVYSITDLISGENYGIQATDKEPAVKLILGAKPTDVQKGLYDASGDKEAELQPDPNTIKQPDNGKWQDAPNTTETFVNIALISAAILVIGGATTGVLLYIRKRK